MTLRWLRAFEGGGGGGGRPSLALRSSSSSVVVGLVQTVRQRRKWLEKVSMFGSFLAWTIVRSRSPCKSMTSSVGFSAMVRRRRRLVTQTENPNGTECRLLSDFEKFCLFDFFFLFLFFKKWIKVRKIFY